MVFELKFAFREGFFENAQKEEDAKQKAYKLCDGECEPYEIHIVRKGEKERRRNENDELSADADDEAVHALTKSLAGCRRDDGKACKHEGYADHAKGYLADLKHIGGGIKEAEKLLGQELEHGTHKKGGCRVKFKMVFIFQFSGRLFLAVIVVGDSVIIDAFIPIRAFFYSIPRFFRAAVLYALKSCAIIKRTGSD